MTDEDDTVASDPRDLDTILIRPGSELDEDTAVTAAETAPVAAIPPRLAPTDVVPALRRELVLTRVKGGGVDVRDPHSGETFTLNEYEHSLARMLDGKRQVAAILQAGDRLGMPVNIESLAAFIQQLERVGLLTETADAPANRAITAPAGAAPAASAWPTRGQWEANVRGLFQSGIRLLRGGKPDQAAGYFEALLAQDPDNVEAQELLAMAQQAVEAAETPPAPPSAPSAFGPTAMPGAYAPTPNAPMPGAYAPTPNAPMPGAYAPTPNAPMPGAYAPPTTPMPSAYAHTEPIPNAQFTSPAAPWQQPRPAMPSAPHPRRRGVWIVAIGTIAIGILSFVVVSIGGPSDAPRDAHELAPNTRMDAAKVASTDPVVDASVVASIDAPAVASVDASSDAPVSAVAPVDAAPESVPSDAAEPSPPQVQLVRVDAPVSGQVTSFLAAPRKVKKGEVLFQVVTVSGDPAKIKELTGKVAELTQLAKQDPMYEPFLADARAELGRVRKVVTTPVKASRAGKAEPRVKAGATVHAGQLLAEIEEP